MHVVLRSVAVNLTCREQRELCAPCGHSINPVNSVAVAAGDTGAAESESDSAFHLTELAPKSSDGAL